MPLASRRMSRSSRPERRAQYRSSSYEQIVTRLAANVRRLRKLRNWTQERVAFECKMPLRLVQRLEARGTNATATTLARLCKGLKVDVTELLAA